MIITTRNPKHLKLGKQIEVVTRRMAILSEFMLTQRNATGKLAAFIEDLENEEELGDLNYDTEVALTTMDAVRNSILNTKVLFEINVKHFAKLDRELQMLTRKAVKKELEAKLPLPTPTPTLLELPPPQPKV